VIITITQISGGDIGDVSKYFRCVWWQCTFGVDDHTSDHIR